MTDPPCANCGKKGATTEGISLSGDVIDVPLCTTCIERFVQPVRDIAQRHLAVLGRPYQGILLGLPFPPSTNAIWIRRKGGGVAKSSAVTKFRADVRDAALQERADLGADEWSRLEIPWSGPVAVHARLTRPGDGRKHDIDNCAKSLLDALENRLYDDDDQVVRVTLERAPTRGTGVGSCWLWARSVGDPDGTQ